MSGPPPILNQAPFTLENLPYGVISSSQNSTPHCATAIGIHAIDLCKYAETREFNFDSVKDGQLVANALKQSTLNEFAALPAKLRQQLRSKIQDDLRQGMVPIKCLVPLSDVKMHLPMKTGGYSDFYTSLEHCQNCSGEMTSSKTFNIPKNWFYAPSVYNSRVSSVVPTPTDIRRPKGVYFKDGMDGTPEYGPSQKLDFELEMGYFISKPVPYGERMPIASAKEHIFGFVLLNDWSARDHQLFEMRPLGPFHSKGFGTSISNWIVPMEALEPYSCSPKNVQDPPPFEHLTWPGKADGALDIKLSIKLVRNGKTHELSKSNLKYLYWTPYQQLTHHAGAGCGMETGDLIGTGTISGSGTDSQGRKTELGCLYEAERTKTDVVPLENAKYNGYLEDGDEIVLEGWCEDAEGKVVLGFGECRGKILPAN
ncbi:fumarylacetoacetate hydrolase [Aulographum hederae CBS 113979]|uniref:Fumarylacetoacetase n=1 Tax=Aulographum hederae CBS 113979 TaxID=1176131 RepID=A0A6G1H4R2_9PEZI|nr:fumarylacetoacetate hydrolase [Aulographum hederae CBS 113979]